MIPYEPGDRDPGYMDKVSTSYSASKRRAGLISYVCSSVTLPYTAAAKENQKSTFHNASRPYSFSRREISRLYSRQGFVWNNRLPPDLYRALSVQDCFPPSRRLLSTYPTQLITDQPLDQNSESTLLQLSHSYNQIIDQNTVFIPKEKAPFPLYFNTDSSTVFILV